MNADRIASLYRWIEYIAFGRALERSRFHFLEAVNEARSVLILGEGDGRFLKSLLSRNFEATVDVVDLSRHMLTLAEARVPMHDRTRVEFHCADATTWPIVESYDLVVTHFFLDCLPPAAASRLIDSLAARLREGGLWIVTEFRQPPRGLARLHARLWLCAMYFFFRISTGLKVRSLPPYEALLASAGLQLFRRHDARFGLITSQLWQKRAEDPMESAFSSPAQ